jgi:hypothetical protein
MLRRRDEVSACSTKQQALLATNVSISLSYCDSSMPDENNRLRLADALARKKPTAAHDLVLPWPDCHALDVRPAAAQRSSVDQPLLLRPGRGLAAKTTNR